MLNYQCVVFDLDGVITQTALVHASAWKVMFDEYLLKVAQKKGVSFQEFTHEKDYLPYVDGKPRYKGVQDFLASRGIEIPFGSPNDSSEEETVCGLGNRKNVTFRNVLDKDGVAVFEPVVKLLRELRDKNIHRAVASSSKNCQLVLEQVGLEDLFETRVDGVISAEMGLKGKPEGDIFVTAAANLGVVPAQAIVIEDAVSGVQAGRNGGFGLVIGVAREGNEKELENNGADIVVSDFGGVTAEILDEWFLQKKKG